MNILIIDDEPIIGELFKRSLSEQGHDITTCVKGVQSLDIISNQSFDLIFLDLMLPDLGGIEVFKHIRRVDEKIPVVIITGLYESDLVNQVMTLGPFMVLKKPFTITTINSIVSILAIGQQARVDVR
ncbi:response regulator [Chloroflexota bacterium]